MGAGLQNYVQTAVVHDTRRGRAASLRRLYSSLSVRN